MTTPPCGVALVTGASRGIGRSAARALAGAGYHVVAVARSQKALESLDDEIRKDEREHPALVADASRAYRVSVSARYPKLASGRYAIWIVSKFIAR